MFRCFITLIVTALSISTSVYAQDTTRAEVKGHYFIQLATTALSSSNRTAFWLQTNQYGTIPSTPQAGLASAGIFYEIPLSKKINSWRINAGFEGILQTQNPAVKGIIVEGYAGVSYKKWTLYGGRKREYYGLSDTLTGMGSLAWSGNALPMPQVYLGTTDFVRVPFVGDWLKIKGYFTHGWFENYNSFVQNSFIHQKGLYGRIGKDSWAINLHGGFSHFVQWGGYADALKNDPGVLSKFGHFNSSWEGYWSVVSGKQMLKKYQGYPMDDFINTDVNRVGNHLGTIDFGLSWRHKNFDLFFYRQSMFDDGSLFYLLNIEDGLNGVRYLNKVTQKSSFYLSRVSVEWLSTMSQGGEEFSLHDPLKRGMDNYFNNNQFQDGWTYFDRSLGTPFIQPTSELKKELQRPVVGLPNNRVEVLNVALTGRYKHRTSWEVRASYSGNYGTYERPFAGRPLNQFSGLVRVGVKMPWLGGSEISGALAYDQGDLYDQTIGGYLSLRKSGILSKKQK